jgi:gluconolactonase
MGQHPLIIPGGSMKLASPILVGAVALCLAACSAGGGGGAGPDSGTGSGADGAAGGGSPGSGGSTTGSGGVSGGSGGAGTGGAAVAEPSGDDGGTGAPADGPAPEVSGSAFTKRWSCPPGPLPNDNIGARTAVCAGFQYRYNYVEGPTWLKSQHAFYFSNFNIRDGHFGDVIKYTPSTGTCESFLQDVGCNGLAVHANGKLLCASHLSHAVIEFDPVTKAKRIIADNYNGRNFASPNDIVAHSNGTIYFTNPTYESISQNPYPQATFWIDPQEKLHLLADGASNGIALSPDEKRLIVVQAGTWSLDDNGVPQQRTGGGPGGDGISVNCAGQVFGPLTNSCFGGEDGKTMLIVSGQGNVRVETAQMQVPGIP